MAFDAGMLACTLEELRRLALGARIEKVYQPERDEIILQMRSLEGGKRLLINAGANNPRIGFCTASKENPQNPPMFCMLLRKYLQGAKLVHISQASFDRVAFLGFETRDEMGFPTERYLIAELMGKYSNLIFTDADKKIISALRTSDFSLDSVRQLLAGGTYSLPSLGDKRNPLTVSEQDFTALLSSAPGDLSADKYLMRTYAGLAPTVTREITYRATGKTDTPLSLIPRGLLWKAFDGVVAHIREDRFCPTVIRDGDRLVEYAFCDLLHYGSMERVPYESAGRMLDDFYESRDRDIRIKQRASDLLRLLTAAESRIRRKMEAQTAELRDCEQGVLYKKYGDLLTANLYRLSRGASSVTLEDYESMREDGSFDTVTVALDSRLSPAANAQRYYKRYNKSKNAKIELTKQLQLGQEELNYIYTVFDALTRAETPTDLSEIRDELYRAGFASRMKSYTEHKSHKPVVMHFTTDDGMAVLCGKNNVQNEYITHKLAEKHDYWFHAKNVPGSHVLLVTEGREPSDRDFTQAAEIAAYHSKAEGQNIAVDYTRAGNVKKPAGGKPGLVIYKTNWTAYVTPDRDTVARLRNK